LVDACPNLISPLADCIETDLFSVRASSPTTSGVTVDQATYSRTVATGGFIDVLASSLPDEQESIQVTDVPTAPAPPEFATTGLKGSPVTAGDYFAHVPYVGVDPPTKVQVSNIGDVPVSTKFAKVVDRIVGTAVYMMSADGTTAR
jgi:hypothetical protein